MKKRNQNVLLLMAVMCVLHIFLYKGKVNLDSSIIKRVCLAVLGLAITLPLHELIHFFLMKLWGMKNVKIEFAIDPLGFPSLRTVGSGELPEWKRRIVTLAPFFVLSVIPDIWFLVTGKAYFMVFIIAMSNAVGSSLDIFFATKKG